MKEEDKKILNDFLAALFFVFSSYISLTMYKDIILFLIFGAAFLISGIYGLICISRKVKFIFAN